MRPPSLADERCARQRSLMWMYLAAGVLAPVSVAVPHYPGTSVAGVLAVGGVALMVGLALWRFGDEMPEPGFPALVVLGTVLISLGINFSVGLPNAATMFYLWISLYSFYFFSRTHAVAQVAVVAAAYTALLILQPPGVPMVANWLTTMGTVFGAGLLVSAMKGRLDALISQLGEAARRDPLTELLNRRGFQELTAVEIARTDRSGRPFSLVLCDLDCFKAINDQLGHAAGDRVLRRVAEVFESRNRTLDTASRLGGEEFALLLPETDLQDATHAAGRLRRDLAGALAAEPVGLTASFGVASFPDHGPTMEALLHSADQALYAAKRLGRDMVVAYEPGETERALEREPDDGRIGAILLLAESLDLRDPRTAAHSQTVARYAESTARRLGLPPARAERIRLAGMLHDVGKISIPDEILHKPGALSDDEYARMQRHPEIGARLIEGAGLDDLSRWVHAHHERPDGRGYPRGLAGDALPIEARILAVADAFEAMTADRPYRPAMSLSAAREELQRHAGSQFDPVVVDALLAAVTADDAAAVAG